MADATDNIPDPIMKIYMEGSGKMNWDIPKEGTIARNQVYELLGMVRYAEIVLIDMLKQPAPKQE